MILFHVHTIGAFDVTKVIILSVHENPCHCFWTIRASGGPQASSSSSSSSSSVQRSSRGRVYGPLPLPSTVFPTMKWRHHVEPEICFSCRSTYFLFENVLKKDMYSPEARTFIETSCFASHVCAGFWLSNSNHWLGNSSCVAGWNLGTTKECCPWIHYQRWVTPVADPKNSTLPCSHALVVMICHFSRPILWRYQNRSFDCLILVSSIKLYKTYEVLFTRYAKYNKFKYRTIFPVSSGGQNAKYT